MQVSHINSRSKMVAPSIVFPEFRGDRLYMHPVDLAKPMDLPEQFSRFKESVEHMLAHSPVKEGIAWVTIDEKHIMPGKSHRRGGPHTDGNYLFGWGGGGGWLTGVDGRVLSEDKHIAQYASEGGGMLIAASHQGCRGWNVRLEGIPLQGGNCENFLSQLETTEAFLMEPNAIYWGNSTFVHESLPFSEELDRTLIRITLPHTAPELSQ